MIKLDQFPPPPLEGETSKCEYNGHLTSLLPENGLSLMSREFQNYQSLHFNKENIRNINRENNENLFLETEESLGKRAVRAWNEKGITGLIEELSDDQDNNFVCKLARVVNKSLNVSQKLFLLWQGLYYPHRLLTTEQSCQKYSLVSDWAEGQIRCFAWHPQTYKFALCLKDDTIHLSSHSSNVKPHLKHGLQKNVVQIAWKPYCSSVLAVACSNGIILWHINPVSQVTRPSSGCFTILKHKYSSSVTTTIAWHPSGTYLASASIFDTYLYIWDMTREDCVPLIRTSGGGINLLKWSPNGQRLLATTLTSNLRVWNTKNWTSDSWSNIDGYCQAACWSPTSDILLFVSNQTLYCLAFPDSILNPVDCASAVSVADLSPVFLPNEESLIGGVVADIEWDKTGERLAILFKDNSKLIAVFRTSFAPTLQISPWGFIRGPRTDKAQCMQFHNMFNDGALLTVCWSNGEEIHIPFLFQRSIKHSSLMPDSSALDSSLHHESYL